MYSTFQKWQSTKYPPIFAQIEGAFDRNKAKVVREDLVDIVQDITQKPCFVLKNVLSKDECKALIAAAEKQGFEEAEKYCHMYHDRYNDRLMSDDPKFSELIWERTQHLLPEMCEGWKLKSLNRRWRYCRYHKGHYFGGHVDGAYAPSRVERSGLTFMLYLNSPLDGDYEGGSTNFLTRQSKLKKQIVPETGMALVFLQEDMELYHEGALLTSGTKHILRTDVMYGMPGYHEEEDVEDLK